MIKLTTATSAQNQRLLMPPDPQTRKSPGSATNTPEAPQQRKQHGHITIEFLGTVVAGLIFSACMWASIAGMTGTDTPSQSDTVAGLLTLAGRRKTPPYAKQLRPGKGETLWVCAGSAAWDVAKSETWFPGRKTLLPPGASPSEFRWDFARHFDDVVIVAEGQPPTGDTLRALAGELLQHTETLLYLPPKQAAVRFTAGARHD